MTQADDQDIINDLNTGVHNWRPTQDMNFQINKIAGIWCVCDMGQHGILKLAKVCDWFPAKPK